ncbi:MAG TPA: SdrD B-like domain-containing protein, partial [Armatimonadota bacterium]|nr:SdrD B-like domain-containing protein [Armatimonadota bacterium]
VFRGSASGGPYNKAASNISTAGYLDSGLTNGETYYYVVTALGIGGESANSAEVTATPQVPAPAPPTGVSAQAGAAQITLNWTASSGATGYNVKRSSIQGGPYTTVATASTTGYTNAGLTNGTTYYYVITALGPGGESANSAEVSAVPNVPPTAPTNLVATPVSGSEIDLTWSDTGAADSFQIERMSSGSGFTQIGSVGGSVTSFADTTVQPNVTYTYRVRATQSGVSSDYSNLSSATAGVDSISGVVATNFNNALLPLPGITVQLLNATGAAVLNSVTTDNNGVYRFTNLLDGTYTVKVVPPNAADSVSAQVAVRLSVNNGIGAHNFIVNSLTIFPQGLSLVSLPYDYTGLNLDAAAVFSLPVAADGSATIAGFDPVTNQYGIYPSLPVSGTTTMPGVGYWILEPTSAPFTQAGNVVPSPFDLTLNPGWNLIGDPFLAPLNASSLQFQVGPGPVTTPMTFDAAVAAGVIGNAIFGYSPTTRQYYQTASIEPFQGYWIYVNPQETMNQPVTARFSAGG